MGGYGLLKHPSDWVPTPPCLAIQLGEGAREQGTGGFWVGVKAIGESPKGRRSLGLRESAPICFPVTGWSREVLVLP